MKKLQDHIVQHGLLSLGLAAFSIFSLRGFEWNLLALFALPTGTAFVFARTGKSPISQAFLLSVGIASFIAHCSLLFPQLGSHSPFSSTPPNNRLMTLYLGIYITWILIVIPIVWFGGSLRARRRGETAKFSAFTCYLGLFTASLFWLVILFTLPSTIVGAGLWPIF